MQRRYATTFRHQELSSVTHEVGAFVKGEIQMVVITKEGPLWAAYVDYVVTEVDELPAQELRLPGL